MHEQSLVKSLIHQIDEELRQRGLCRLAEVRLEIGEFAGVEPRLLSSAFEELSADYWGAAPRLSYEIVSLTACCRGCGRRFVVDRFRFECPDCSSRQVDVTEGEELRLVSLRAESVSHPKDAAPS